MFELYVFDVTKIKDSDITDGSWVRAIVTALKMQGNSVSERWSPKRGTGAPRTGAYNIHDVIKGPKSILCPGPHKTSRRPCLCLVFDSGKLKFISRIGQRKNLSLLLEYEFVNRTEVQQILLKEISLSQNDCRE